ncbi:glycosyltransferase [Lyngbya confervoides]|uniref:Glycosyltransferase family 4 protein n=1 Tax=Lyngbya confervoides BDU141951 TaxID=1574623 RepID=A0ABD4T382_9CYAN|nr:glycosyltransferase [Lyngbya confervoides]MCM1983109.1 glycosyltransferase family 4 protein [Lyngbya confervoides BDU141951]
MNQQFYAELEQQMGWDITIVLPKNWQSEYGRQLTPRKLEGFSGKLIAFPVWFSGNIPLHCYRSWFAGLVQRSQPDFIFVHEEPYAIAAFQLYCANQITRRVPIAFYTWQNIHKQYPLPFRLMEQFVYRNSTFAFAGSQSVQQVLETKGFSKKIEKLPLGIDAGRYSPHPEALTLKQTLTESSPEVLIGYLGRITEEKGLKTLAIALGQLMHLPWRLVVIGSGDYEAIFSDVVQRLNLSERVRCLGFIPHEQSPRYLSAFDVLVLPSETRPHWKEQFGRVLIESMACGTPVLGSDSGEIPWIIHETGGGLVFSEGNPGSLAQQLKRLLQSSDLRRQLAEQGRRSVLQTYTNPTLVRHFAQLLQTCVRSKIA